MKKSGSDMYMYNNSQELSYNYWQKEILYIHQKNSLIYYNIFSKNDYFQ